MYLLNREAFRTVDPDRLVPFVECWERYYVDDDHEYFAELNLGDDLTGGLVGVGRPQFATV